MDEIQRKIDQVVSVDTKSEVEYKVTPYKTIQKYEPNLPKGTTIVTGGENGSTKSITPYYLDEKTGYVQAGAELEVKNPVDKVIVIGTKESN